jgi:hypothetical protein
VSLAPLVSLLIPTRNRPELCALAVEAALRGLGPDDELVLADNGDAPLDLPAPLASDPRLRHLRPGPRPLSMPDNWERALQAARGEWLLLLADKYMLVPGALTALRRRLDARPSLRLATYGYAVLRQELPPGRDRDPAELRARGGELRWPANHAETALLDARAALRDLYARPAYPRRHPMLYTALAHRDLIADGRRHGRFFVGSCPDVVSAARLLAACDAYLDTHLPLVMVQYPGDAAAWSTGAATVAGGDLSRRFFGELGDAQRREPVERLVAGAILETLLAFAATRPDLAESARLDWTEFAKQAAREIEGLAFLSRPGWHLRLLGYLHRRGALTPGVAYAQARTALASHLPRRLLARLLDWRRRAFSGAPPPDALLPVARAEVATRDEALSRLASLVADGA